MIRVFIADNSTAVRIAIRRLLEQEPSIEVVGEAEDYTQTMKLLQSKSPDVLICDLRMPSGAHFQPFHIADLARACRCIVIAVSFAEPNGELNIAASELGADHLLDKTKLFDELVPTIREATQSRSSSVSS